MADGSGRLTDRRRPIAGDAELENVRVITKDSDLAVYEVSTSITLPVGNQWKTFQKQDLLYRHQLPTPAHHLLLGILTTNDYTGGAPFYGLVSDADIVRKFELEGLEELNDQERLERFKHYVAHYLKIVHDNAAKVIETAVRSRAERLKQNPNPTRSSKADEKDSRRIEKAQSQLSVGTEQFNHALQAFVNFTEHPLRVDRDGTTPCAPDTHNRVRSIIQGTELKKAYANWERFSKIRTPHAGPSATAPINQEPPLTQRAMQQSA
ncbi:hypothetical protein EDD21DRAFT_405931 [Dissophora ornata]|nr:hypothetical protein BGZ58_006834 [Dissophora ornata]KAI8599562.1 hypothetical protein EDD21DRAFT_405931 [Dissophora ornata]